MYRMASCVLYLPLSLQSPVYPPYLGTYQKPNDPQSTKLLPHSFTKTSTPASPSDTLRICFERFHRALDGQRHTPSTAGAWPAKKISSPATHSTLLYLLTQVSERMSKWEWTEYVWVCVCLWVSVFVQARVTDALLSLLEWVYTVRTSMLEC